MRLTFSRRALVPCAGFAATAVLGSALVTVPTSAAAAAETFTRRVSAEATAFTDATGATWEARTGFDGGGYYNPGSFDVAGTTNDKLYQSEYWGITGWHSAVPAPGEYDVTLHLREAWYTAPGQRVFDVSAEGRPALTGLDIVKAVGARTAYDKTFRVTVSDGRLDLGFKASVDDALVSGITVTAVPAAPAPSTGSSAVTVTQSGGTATLTWASATNPAKGWYVQRDGNDANGYGPWSTMVAGTARSQSFALLAAGRTYTLAVTNADTGEKRTATVTIGATTPAPAPTTSSPSPSPTSGTGLNPAGTGLAATVSYLGSSATLTWTSSTTPSKGWYVQRDGSDAGGYGPWSTMLGGSARSQTFAYLVPGRSYTLSVTDADTGAIVSKTVTIPTSGTFTPSPAPTTSAPAPAPTPSSPAPAPTTSAPVPGGTGSATARLFGTPRSGKPWFSGAWRAAPFTPASVDAIGTWRGSAMDAVTTYSNKNSLSEIANSQWNVTTYNGFGGILSYNLTLIPYDRSASFASVARGDQDWVWKQNAQILKANGRGTSLVNIGWEMNGDWWPWSATTGTAEQFKAAYNRVASVMRAEAPGLKFGFIIACGRNMTGGGNRLDAITKLYPGDQFVDVVGCNTYDWWGEKARNEAEWASHIRPAGSPGIADFADLARQRGKGMAIPEWGPAATSVQGSGDNPFFIQKMYEWLVANKDVVVLENYFMEASAGVANSLVSPVQMPNSAAKYASLW